MPKTINTTVESVPLNLLKPHPRNVNQGDFGAIMESVQTNGFYGTIVANKRTGHILAGNHRYAVAKQMGYDTIPVAWVDVDDEEEIRILVADNRTTRLGNDDEAALSALLAELAGTPTGLTGTGFDGDDLDRMIADLSGNAAPTELLTDPDEVPESAPTRCNLGDLWQLGRHRLICGDSTDAATVERLMGGQKAAAMWTDPPYGVSYGDKNRHLNEWGMKAKGKGVGSQSGWSRIETPIENDELDEAQLRALLDAAFANALTACRAGAAWYVAAPAGPPHTVFALALQAIGVLRHTLVWVKDGFVFGRCDYHYRHEPVFYGWTPGSAHEWHGDRSQSSVFEVPKPRKNDIHPTMKPVALVEAMLRNSCKPGEVVYEPFGGSGTTLVACEAMGLCARVVELSPAYCDVILKRWEDATGETATLLEAGDGR